MSLKLIKIGTRESELALWQANLVSTALNKAGVETEIVKIKSEGDIDLKTPLSEMGGKGVFTKALDEALLSNKIDIAVHSQKDLPTENELPLSTIAVMERGDYRDSLVTKNLNYRELPHNATIATGSNRRKSQWLNRFPKSKLIEFRGNVNTRLKKVEEQDMHGAIFAAAGLQRINKQDKITQYLDWMVPAPAQGAVAVVTREGDERNEKLSEILDHPETNLCTSIERQLLNVMEAGCSAPVGALAKVKNDKVHFKAVALTINGRKRYDFEDEVLIKNTDNLGRIAAKQLLNNGAQKIIDSLK